MLPLQDSALRLSDARKTRLEVFFHFIIIIIIIIMDLVLRVRKAFIQVKYGLVSPMRYITALQSEMSFGYTFFFLFFFKHQGFTFTGLVMHKGHPLWGANLPQFCQASQCRNCLAQQACLFFSRTLANHQGFLRVPPL